MDQFARHIIRFAVHAGNVNDNILCQNFNKIIAGKSLPQYLNLDHDPLFAYHRWQANLRVLEVEEIKTVPGVLVSYPFVERLIRTVRRDYPDHILFWNMVDLELKLSEFEHYYNRERVHASLGGDTPAEVSGESIREQVKLDGFRWETHCRGLVSPPMAA